MYINGIPAYMIKKATRPSYTAAEVKLPHINIERYVKGKSTWDTATLSLYDPIVPSGTQAVMEWIRLGHESVTGRDGYFDFYAKDISVYGLGPVGDQTQLWVYKGAWVTKADFGEWDYGDDSTPMEINLTIRYNYPVLNY